jgi:L-threonylcarbamoyladenylate synthase
MKIVKEKDVDIRGVADILAAGGLVIYPTETTYGIGASAINKTAIEKLNKYKKRPAGKPYSVAVSDIAMAKKYASLNPAAENIYKTFLPGPVTIISTGKHTLAPGVESETGTLGIRIPSYKLVTDIVNEFGSPITATSANASYKKRPYKIADILVYLTEKQKRLIDLIIDAGTLPKNEPSTVIDTTYDDIAILRQGSIYLKNKDEILSRSPEDTKNCAKELWQKYDKYAGKRAVIFALTGKMGSGKTIFTKGLAKAMGVSDTVTSPTYNIVNNYQTKKNINKLVHIDVWRINNTDELFDLDICKDATDRSIFAIEWADKIADAVRKIHEDAIVIWVKIENGKKISERNISWGVEK